MSKTKLKRASYSINKLLKKAKLAYDTKSNYQDILIRCIKTLDMLGFQLENIKQLKQKHIYALVEYWQNQFLSIGTIKNNMSALRFSCRLLGKKNIIASNSSYNIGNRTYIPEISKAVKDIDLNRIADPYIKMSLELQKSFGLRREECLKFIPETADKEDHIALQASWTKGGIPRSIPILNKEQRDCLDRAKILCGSHSLIPQKKTYIAQRNLYDRLTHKAGFYNLHGLRHAYAQKRYLDLCNEITNGQGWRSSADGGKKQTDMTKSEKIIDKKVREIVSRELGHSRINVTCVYLNLSH